MKSCVAILAFSLTVLPRVGAQDVRSKVGPGPDNLGGILVRPVPLQTPESARRHDALMIAEATRPCTPEVATWWQALRTAGKEIVDADRAKNEFITAWYQARPSGPIKPPPKKDVDRLDGDIARAITKYKQRLEEGRLKAYNVPIGDSARALVLHNGRPNYTEQARRDKINGSVRMRAEFRNDGTIGDVNVVSGLKDGLDDEAIKAIRETVFLPAVKDGMFVAAWMTTEASFNLR